MNLTPVQSSAKSGSSDFSIQRILSEDSKTPEKEIQLPPNWMSCTRYQPPRLPRTPHACRPRRSGRHARVPFTSAQASALEAAYSRAPYLAPPALRALAAALQLRDDRIKIWFQNRRARERREKSCAITPPSAVALPMTASPSRSLSSVWYSQREIQTSARGEDNFDTANNPCMNSSSEESNGSRCETPLDVETVGD